MAKQLLLSLAAAALFIIAVGIFTQKQASLNLAKYVPSPKAEITKTGEVTIDGHTIKVEIADTFNTRAKGLSGRSSMDANSGMLFVFESKKTLENFWMKDMLIPLDFIWIADGKIVKIDKNVPAPAPNTPDGRLPFYAPGQPIDYVLEVNANYTDKNGVKVGDSVTLPASI